ncbi:hypothetical protein FA13DRAFT_1613136, partial [Coprinellus micaceus]
RHVQRLHTSAVRSDRVAPPHPISHMRPIIYDDAPAAASPPALLRHPYSLSEFQDATDRPVNLELQFKLQRQQLDAFHHNFWLDNNVRYYAAKETILTSLPESATPLDRENAISEFNTNWYNQEKERVDIYTAEWRKRNAALLRLGAKVEVQKLTFRVSR